MKNILLAISGLTPQIVTETLFALSVQKDIKIDEIFIVTTSLGKTVIEGKDKSANTPNVSLKNEIANLCKEYEIQQPKFSVKKSVFIAEEESLKLYDIKTDKDNLLFPNKVAELIKNIASDNNTVIHACLSGGRKSMSAHLALVMSLFARSQDKLYHVLTDEEFEFKNFYPKTRKEERALIIAEIPFVKLRSINAPILKSNINYSKLVELTQKRLKFLTDKSKLLISIIDRKVIYGDNEIKLEPLELGLYLLFIERKQAREKPYSIHEIQSVDFAAILAYFLTEKYNSYFDNRNKKHWSKKGLSIELFNSKRSKINKKLKVLFNDESTYEEYKIKSKRGYGDSLYYISAPKDKLTVNYE